MAANTITLISLARVLNADIGGGAVAQLDDYDRSRYAAINHPMARARFLTGRVLARITLSEATGYEIDGSAWHILPDAKGKPRITGPLPDVGISIAHTEDVVGVAVCANGDVGLDLECLNDGENGEPVLEALSSADQRKLKTCAPEHRTREFVKLWTMKEAYAKWAGEGVGLDFGALDFDWVPRMARQSLMHGPVRIHQYSMCFNKEFSVALASGDSCPPLIRFRNLEASRLFAGEASCMYNFN
ncbi:4'-phosphopantetheinyl transferase family protein [Terrihabitans soli]|uniref:4'-phosphopantetheinyl transferase family protein n=1 Tax=Terrihabitans soli TaxID=708113 RepID=UPI001CA3840E|nr:4'-phosphopantetheinyl transferase superfamily protein [Terrihabitans soli]